MRQVCSLSHGLLRASPPSVQGAVLTVLGPQDRAGMLGTAELAFEGLGRMSRMPFS